MIEKEKYYGDIFIEEINNYNKNGNPIINSYFQNIALLNKKNLNSLFKNLDIESNHDIYHKEVLTEILNNKKIIFNFFIDNEIELQFRIEILLGKNSFIKEIHKILKLIK